MSNPFQEQLLKTGLVSKQQAHKAKQHKSKKNKQQHTGDGKTTDDTSLTIQQAAEEKARRDRELNRKKEENARQKSISIEINQLIKSNCIERDESCDIVYNFEHNKKVNRIYVNTEMKQKIIQGKLGIARIEGRYELVPEAIADKIRQRNEKRIVTLGVKQPASDGDYTSAEHQIPDDLTW